MNFAVPHTFILVDAVDAASVSSSKNRRSGVHRVISPHVEMRNVCGLQNCVFQNEGCGSANGDEATLRLGSQWFLDALI